MSEEEQIMEPATKKLKLDEDHDTSIKQDESNDATIGDIPTEVSGNEYNNFVSPEEMEKLREFKVLDEVKSNDEDSNDDESDSDDGKSEDLPEEEIEKMLEEDLPEGFKGAPKPKEKPYVTRKKIVLEEKGVNHFEVLPLNWIMVRHFSGMPIYVHRTERVCTLSKPYFLGKGNTKRHDIPISAIPCYAYRRALEEEEKQKEIDRKIEEQIKNGTWKNLADNATKTNNAGDVTSETNAMSKDDNEMSKNENETNKDDNETSKNDAQASNNDSQNNKNENKTCKNENEPSKNDDNDSQKTTDEALATEINNYKEEIQQNIPEQKCPFSNGENSSQNIENVSQNDENSQKPDDDDIPLNRKPVVLPGGIVMPPPRVETVNTSWKTQHLSADQVNDYCKKLFKFKTVNIMHFMCWADRRKYTKARKALQYPALPDGTKLVSIPAPAGPGLDHGKAGRRDWVMNMNGCSYLSEFHEYVRRALQKQPVYEFKQLENAATPYQATVYIGGMQYGVGHGSSKRQAKSAAARASIQILIPEMKDEPAPAAASEPDFTFFDYVGIEDPRITEFCAATCEPSPHAILRTCLLRNFGAGDRHIHTEMKKEFQKIELTMKVGKHSATVVCKNKKTAKQRASQAILQALHPHVRSWGSLLRLYGSRSVKSCKEKKLEEQQITLLQDKARPYEPNYAVLEKLRNEMRKLRERDAAVVPIGTLLVADALPTHSGANLGNVEL